VDIQLNTKWNLNRDSSAVSAIAKPVDDPKEKK
jgi:hypothetical protein